MRSSPIRPLFAILAGAALLLAACDDDPSGSEPPTLLVCTEPAAEIVADATVVGGDGEGQLIRVGNHTLAVPADAIPDGHQVRFALAQLPSQDVRVVVEVESDVQFASDLTLTLSYAGRGECTLDGVPVTSNASLSVYNIDRGEPLPRVDVDGQAVAGTTTSFSTFVIAH